MDTTFFKSLKQNKLEDVKNFIDANPDILSYKDASGNSLLMTSIFWRANDVAKYLIDKDIDIHSVDNEGWNALFLAILRNNVEIAQILVGKGININHLDNELTTPLMLCITEDNDTIFNLLISNKVDCNLINSKGKTVFDMNMPMKFRHILNLNKNEPEPSNLVETLELTDNLTFEDLEPGDKYAFRINDSGKAYFMCKIDSITQMINMKYKGSSENSVFDMISNKTVPYSSIRYCIRGDIGPIFRDIINGRFKYEEGMDVDMKDPVLQRPLISWLIKFNQNEAAKKVISLGAILDVKDRDDKSTIDYVLDNTDMLGFIPKDKIAPRITNRLLWDAINYDNRILTKFLLQSDFDLDVNWRPNPDSLNMLALALIDKGEEIANILLDKGATFNEYIIKVSYITEWIAENNCIQIAKRLCPLLKDGKYYNYTNSKDVSPLAIAISRDNCEIAKIFLENGADKYFRESGGKLPIERAKSPEMKVLLADDPEKQICINKIHMYLDGFDKLPSKSEKIKVAKELYDYVYTIESFIKKHNNFREALIRKGLQIKTEVKEDASELIQSIDKVLHRYSVLIFCEDANLSNLFEVKIKI